MRDLNFFDGYFFKIGLIDVTSDWRLRAQS